MDLAALSHATALAGVIAVAFACLLFAGSKLPQLSRGANAFKLAVSNVSAQRWRLAWHRLGVQRALCLLPLLCLIIATPTLLVAESRVPGLEFEKWQQVLLLASVATLAMAALVRALQLTWRRIKVRQRVDAGIAVGQALQRITANQNRTFHDVPTAFGSVDHVIAGLHGIYAVKVIAQRPRKQRVARLLDGVIDLGNGQAHVSIAHTRKVADRLARECGKALGHDVHVRLIIAVPGWEIEAQTGDDVLLVNERNLMMLTGWKDERDYLMNEDVDTLHRFLDERCVQPPGVRGS